MTLSLCCFEPDFPSSMEPLHFTCAFGLDLIMACMDGKVDRRLMLIYQEALALSNVLY
jgi:hypothetical protein